MKQLVAVTSILIAMIAAGCSDSGGSGTVADDPNASIVPLNVGFFWVMDNTDFKSDGSSTTLANDTIRISPDTHLSTSKGTFYDYNGFWVTKRSDGLYRTTDPLTFPGPYLYLKYPASVGDGFRDGKFTETKQMKIQRAGKADTTITLWTKYTVAAKGRSVSVPAGNYTCYEYLTGWYQSETNITYQEDHLYYAPNTGEIMTEHFERSSNSGSMILKHRSRLVSAHLQ